MNFVSQKAVSEIAANIKLLLLDVDGVLTDGRLYFSNEGQETKAFSTLDGHGIKLLRKHGVEVGIITGRTSSLVEKRASDLGIHLLIQGREDKNSALDELLKSYPCPKSQIAYIGDDHPDLLVMTQVGLAVTVPNAHDDVKANSHWQTNRKGGEGAVREVCDLILKAQDKYDDVLNAYLLQQNKVAPGANG